MHKHKYARIVSPFAVYNTYSLCTYMHKTLHTCVRAPTFLQLTIEAIACMPALITYMAVWFDFATSSRISRIDCVVLPSLSNIIWLVVSTHVKNINQLGWLFPIYGRKNVSNHQPVITPQ